MGEDSPRRPEYRRGVKKVGQRHVVELGLENSLGSWDSLLEQFGSLLHTGLELLRPAERDVAIDLIEAQFGMDLEDRALTIRGHLHRHLAVATQEDIGDGVKAV